MSQIAETHKGEPHRGMQAVLRRGTALGATQVIRSPEQVALDLVIAGPMSRAMAFSIDYLLILVVAMVMFMGLIFAAMTLADIGELTTVLEGAREDVAMGEMPQHPWLLAALSAWVLLEFVLQFGYFVASELWMQGRSIGKAAVGLRVVRTGGLPLTLRESLLRNLLRVADMLPVSYLVGLLSMIFTRDTRRLGDLAAGTIVIRDDRGPVVAPILPGSDELAASAFRLDHQQRAALGPVELRLVRQTLRRVEDISEWKGRKMLERTVEALQARIGHEEPVAPAERRAFLLAVLRDGGG